MKHTTKRAFTLIELLIVIAIIGILFIVLVSKVDFATDKAKASGVQTDFRSFQVALESVSKEKAGFNSFGWNTGDINANGVRDSYDEGDKQCTEVGCIDCKQDGVMGPHEVWTGHQVYTEDWNDECYYTLIRPGTTFEANGYDKDAIFALETAINKNLDPKLHITIDAKTGLITMANGAQDPWNTQYHGAYISAEDGMDRGAIVMYSNGANQKFGSEHDIANGVPTVIVPGNNKNGADDYSMVVVYTYMNGYGEVKNMTTGFSNNQVIHSPGENLVVVLLEGDGQSYYTQTPSDLSFRSLEPLNEFDKVLLNGKVLDPSNYTLTEGSTIVTLHAEFLSTLPAKTHNIVVVSENGSASGKFNIIEQSINSQSFYYDVPYMFVDAETGDLALSQAFGGFAGIMMHSDGKLYLVSVDGSFRPNVLILNYTVSDNIITVDAEDELGNNIYGEISADGTQINVVGFGTFRKSTDVAMSEGEYFYIYGEVFVKFLEGPFVLDKSQTTYDVPLYNVYGQVIPFNYTYEFCENLQSIVLPLGAEQVGEGCFLYCTKLTDVTLPATLTFIDGSAFQGCTSLTTIKFTGTMAQWNSISKPSNWNKDIPATEVICSDGVVTIK